VTPLSCDQFSEKNIPQNSAAATINALFVFMILPPAQCTSSVSLQQWATCWKRFGGIRTRWNRSSRASAAGIDRSIRDVGPEPFLVALSHRLRRTRFAPISAIQITQLTCEE
jgi:hypothetical protein